MHRIECISDHQILKNHKSDHISHRPFALFFCNLKKKKGKTKLYKQRIWLVGEVYKIIFMMLTALVYTWPETFVTSKAMQ